MNEPIQPDWKWGTAEGSRDLDRILDRRLSFREKLEWLEEAETLSLQFQAVRETRKSMQLRVAENPANEGEALNK